tara:strand:+ start:30086 stop:31120 length:1035 start_codon:yes stop_codon:yes gene_type:complete
MVELDLIINKTMEYLQFPSVVGNEKPFLDKLEKDFKSLQLTTKLYPGLLAVQGKKPNSAIVSAHIDRHGLIANGKGELEYAAYRVKNETAKVVINPKDKMWEKIVARFNHQKVYAYDAKTGEKLGAGTINKCCVCSIRNNFVFEVPELSQLTEGTPVSFSTNCNDASHTIDGQLDNVVSAALGFTLFKFGFEGTLLLTKGEEIGESWKHIYDYFKDNKTETKKLFVLDTSPFQLDESVDMNAVILRNRDNNAHFESVLTETIKEKCEALKIPFLVKDEYILSNAKTTNIGNTELGHLISKSNNQISGTTVQIATMGYHSNHEIANYEAIQNVFKILSETLIPTP